MAADRMSIYLPSAEAGKRLRREAAKAGKKKSAYILGLMELGRAVADRGYFLGPDGEVYCQHGAGPAVALPSPAQSRLPPQAPLPGGQGEAISKPAPSSTAEVKPAPQPRKAQTAPLPPPRPDAPAPEISDGVKDWFADMARVGTEGW